MKFSLVTLHVKDIERSLEFYNKLLGIPIIRRQPAGPGKELIFMGKEGDVNLELIPTEADVVYSGFSIGFDVDNLSEAKERLAASGYSVKKELSPAPTVTLCFFEGPNGEDVELVEYK